MFHLQELVSEKLKTQQRDNELERLTHELEMKNLNHDTDPPVEDSTSDDR